MAYLLPRRKKWKKVVITTMTAFLLACFLRLCLGGTQFKHPRETNHDPVVHHGTSHRKQKDGNGQAGRLQLLPAKLPNVPEVKHAQMQQFVVKAQAQKRNKEPNNDGAKPVQEVRETPCKFSSSKNEKYKCWLPAEMTTRGSNFDKAIKSRVDANNVIYLVSVDSGYVDMGLNLYKSSFRKLKIKNFLYVCSDMESVAALKKQGVYCYNFQQHGAKTASKYMSKAFVIKTHIKTKIILGALSLNYTAFIVDADIVFIENPTQFMGCHDCDIEIQSDHVEENSGFYLARPTTGSLKLHADMLHTGLHSNKTSNQKALNRVMRTLRQQGRLKVGRLHKTSFPCGLYYFENEKRMWPDDNPCKSCIIVHNNWMIGKPAKIYRFKEHLMWYIDHRGYYSNPTGKYIVYDNPKLWGIKKRDAEINALKKALQIGYLTERIVVLPTFSCEGCKATACKTASKRCALNAHLRVSTFDGTFTDLYRERMFLSNELVPESVKNSISPEVIIKAEGVAAEASSDGDFKMFRTSNRKGLASADEIKHWFGPGSTFSGYAVIKFQDLDSSFKGIDGKNKKHKTFMNKIRTGFKRATYRQY